MNATTAHKPIVHFVGSIPLPDAETVFHTVAGATAPHLKRLPDGAIPRIFRRSWQHTWRPPNYEHRSDRRG